MNKQEILNGISKLQVDSDYFCHELECDATTTAYHTFVFETENYMVTLELCETVLWDATDFYQTIDLEVESFIVENQEGEIDTNEITDDEILEHINY